MAKVTKSLEGWMFYCPGCGCMHRIDNRWRFNGDMSAPTFEPSYKLESRTPRSSRCCHVIISMGQLQFQADSTHQLAGQTVAMQEMPVRSEGEGHSE